MDGVFEVVFEGRILPGRETSEVKAALARMFKAPEASIERLFAGNLVVIRKDLDYASALRYVSAMREAGALSRLREQDGGPSQPRKVSDSWSVAPVGENLGGPPKAPPVPPQVNLEQFSLAPVGADMSEGIEKLPVPEVDVPQVSIAEVGAQLGTPREVVPVAIGDIDSIGLAEVGAQLGTPREVVPVAVGDIDSITLAEVGATLDTREKIPPPPPPDTAHIKLG